jgi:hypothetical protein
MFIPHWPYGLANACNIGIDELIANPTYTALEPPPEKTYASITAALININMFAAAQGYAVSNKRANKNMAVYRAWQDVATAAKLGL